MAHALPTPNYLIAIKRTRQELGLSQQKIADKLGINQSNYARFEAGKSRLSHENAQKLDEILHLQDYDYLVDYKERYIKKGELFEKAERDYNLSFIDPDDKTTPKVASVLMEKEWLLLNMLRLVAVAHLKYGLNLDDLGAIDPALLQRFKNPYQLYFFEANRMITSEERGKIEKALRKMLSQ
jgi:transcriptional regulator with XRE-family HTH domain